MTIAAAFAGVVVIWATTPLAIKWSSEGAGFLFGVISRMVLGVVVCLVLLALRGRRVLWHRAALATYLAAGFGLRGAMTSVCWASQFIPSGLISVIFGLTPVVTGIMSVFRLGEQVSSPLRSLGMVLGIGGLALVFGGNLAVAPNCSPGHRGRGPVGAAPLGEHRLGGLACYQWSGRPVRAACTAP